MSLATPTPKVWKQPSNVLKLTTHEHKRPVIDKKDLVTFRFFLDSIESATQRRLERRIKLLGASVETFFSAKCTHLITPKAPIEQQENITPTDNNNTNKPHIKDDIVEKAKKWNIKVWSLDYTINFLHALIEPSNHGRRADEKKVLGKIYQEEKLFGLSTSSSSDGHSNARPQFVPFRGHYCLVEDVTNVHRAPVIKEYSRHIMDKSSPDFPWPYLKRTPANNSPFSRILRDKTREQNEKAKQGEEKKKEGEVKEEDNNNKPMTPPTPAMITTTNTNSNNNEESGRPGLNRGDSHLRASGFHPSTTTNTAATTISRTPTSTTATDTRRLIPTDSVNRLDRRMIENIPQLQQQHQQQQQQKAKQEHLRSQAIKQSIQQQQKREQQKKMMKEMDLGFCENCNKRFSNLEEHIKEDAHQAFIKDQNNFKKLDDLLEKTRRQYKSPLPERMRAHTDPSIDGKNVKYQSDMTHKRKRPSIDKLLTPTKVIKQDDVKISNNENDTEGWGKFYNVFL
ncbi:hypothetical protein K501DRAFT_331133 [Backusella circina FSU 941]|nr:hypothetical protein K501DRAFT_331133 [Backusella circina FSU 941]